MKINRLTRFIAILLVVTMMPLWMFGCGGGSSDIREGLVDMMVGDGKLNDKNQVTKDYVTQLDSEVAELVLYYSKEGLWLPTYLEPGSTYVGRFYENCYKLAMAWATKESEYYHSGMGRDNLFRPCYGIRLHPAGAVFLRYYPGDGRIRHQPDDGGAGVRYRLLRCALRPGPGQVPGSAAK